MVTLLKNNANPDNLSQTSTTEKYTKFELPRLNFSWNKNEYPGYWKVKIVSEWLNINKDHSQKIIYTTANISLGLSFVESAFTVVEENMSKIYQHY